MTDATIKIPDYVSVVEPAPALPVCDLAKAAADLLGIHADLPVPRAVTVSAFGQEIEMQFAGDQSSFKAMALWAQRFGGTITAEPRTGEDGHPLVRCEIRFTTGATPVKGYAWIEAKPATT